MARTPSNMLSLGTKLPSFRLPDTDGHIVDSSAKAFQGKPMLVMFICNHCPFVIHVQKQLAAIGQDYQNKGLSVVAINSNDAVAYPDDSPEKMKLEKVKAGYTFPYLFDETQEVAKAFDAACTPDFYLFNKSHELVYRGQLDNSRPSNQIPVDGRDLRAAIEATLSGESVPYQQKPSLGCNIKWKQ